MSSLATPGRGAAATGTARPTSLQRVRPGLDALLGSAFAIAFSLVAFVSTGGTGLGANTGQEIALMALGVGAGGAALVWRVPGARWGAGTLALFGVLATLTALSIAWSVQPDASWSEASRTLSYLAAFGSAIVLARLIGHRWAAFAGGLAAFAALLSAYALLVKVFPATFDQSGFIGRLSAPFDYWNATGVVAAMGLPLTLWVGARHEGRSLIRGLAAPALALELAVVVLSLSRSAAVAAVAGLAVWFGFVPLRLRGVALLAIGAVGGAAISVWALGSHALIHDRVPLAARVPAGQAFGVALLLITLLIAGLGLAGAYLVDVTALTPPTRRRIGTALVASLGLIPLLAVAALASSSRGVGGEISHIWSSLTSTRGHVSDDPGRLVALASTRPQYWSQGLKILGRSPLHGVGALGYATARQRYTMPHQVAGDVHAHSYAIETLADFGILGGLVNLALLTAWVLAVRRTLGRAPPSPDAASDEATPETIALERACLVTLLAVVVAYGVQSLVDWTWFVPGTTLPALACAGWLAGRGRPGVRVRRTRLPLSRHPLRVLAIMSLLAAGVLTAWAVWQPLRSQQAGSAAVAAATRGDIRTALLDARQAAARDPLALDPHFELSALLSAVGRRNEAHAELVKAVRLQPDNPEAWRELGFYDLQHGLPRGAIGVLRTALRLDPSSDPAAEALAQAQAQATAR